MHSRMSGALHITFAVSLHAAFFLGFLRITLPVIPIVYPLSLVLAMFSGGAVMLLDSGKNLRRIWARIYRNIAGCKCLSLGLLLYILLDTIGLLYSPNPSLALEKTVQMALKAVLALLMLYYIERSEQLERLIDNLIAVGLVSALGTYLLYFWGQPVYWQRLTAVRDYNQFSLILLMSLICLFVRLFYHEGCAGVGRFLFLGGACVLYFPIFLLSGSRRTMLLAPCVLLFLLIFTAIMALVQKRPDLLRRVWLSAACFLLAGLAALLFAGWFEQQAELRLISPQDEQPSQQGGTQGGNTLDDTIQTVINGKAVAKRTVIWNIALEDIREMTPVQWMFGRGAGYDLYLYDRQVYPALEKVYPDVQKSPGWMNPHSFVFSDLLTGGLLKLSVSLFVLVMCVITVCRLFRIHSDGILYFLPLGLCFVNSSISGRFGLFYDKAFWFFVILLIGAVAVWKRDDGGLK